MAPAPDRHRREELRRRERALRRAGYERIAGTDEAGMGPLAGPLVAAAVILPPRARLPGVDDSKRLTATERERWAARVRACALAAAVVEISAAEVDRVGPYVASLRAKAEAVRRLAPPPDFVLIDAHRLPDLPFPQEAVPRADGRFLAVAAASLLAKTHRDAVMAVLDGRYPGYGFARHKGYGTKEHLEALARLGPCPEHRRRYAPVRRAEGRQRTLPAGP